MSASDIIGAVSCLAPYTVDPIVKQVKYVFNYKENLTNLPIEVQKLVDLKKEIEGLVSSAQMNAEDIKGSVGDWIKKADEIAEAARQMIQEEDEQSKKRCFFGLCPNPVSRHRSSRKAFKETMQIVDVQKEGRDFKGESVSIPPSAVPTFPVTATLGKDFLDFNSRSKTWEDIMKALKDQGANVIGVYGMGGLGKTTLVKQVAARAAEEKFFDEVVVPVVTEKNVLDAEGFQDEMAKVLNMKLDDQWKQWNVSQRADRIRKRLTNDEKKTIVVLDDLRAKLNLEQVGIPFGVGFKGCKILFTSRFKFISYAAQKTITLGVLEEEEAWALFQKLVGDVLKKPGFLNIGKEVTKNCKGLPILIVTIAGALLSRISLGEWNDALLRLQQEESEATQEFVNSALEYISFNHLLPANKSLFLLCGLLGGGEISIFDQLLKLGLSWGLFERRKTMEEARNNLETLIHDLKASFLLFDGQSVDTVRMHDVVRDVAIKIASNEGHNMLLGSSDNWPEDDVLRKCTALTFPYGIVPEPPECLESPSLKFLLLYHNLSSLKITDNLFEKMQKLTILDIRSIDLSPKLPSSLAFLENLHTLSLKLCKLVDISIVGALKKLKILSLSSTGVEKLPMEVGNLSELRILDLNGCSELKVVPPGIIKRLTQLEELHMAKSFSQWEVEGNASLNELNYLVKLTTLRIHVPDAKLLPKDFYFEKLERFTILIGGEEWGWACHDEKSLYRFRGIKVKVNGSMDSHLEGVLEKMLKRTEILYLDGMKNIHELEWKSFEELKFVHIQHSAETRYIVNAVESFPTGLESLFLSDLPQLQNVCRGMFMAESSFSQLKCVNVDSCNSLRNLFSFSMAKGLPHLEEVKVTNCNSLEGIVEDTREDDKNGDTVMDKLEFRQLRCLILECLPKLASFCNSGTNRQKLVSTNEISSEDGCTIVAPFFSYKVLFPKLKELEVKECDSMEYLFNQSIVMGLEQLQFLTINNCKSLKGIVAHVEGEETNAMIKFPQLVKLFLEVLPCLTRFCSGSSIVFPTLTVLWIVECQQIKTFVWEDKTMTNKKFSTAKQALFDDKVELPNLKSILLWDLDNVETIWHNRLHEDSFFNLERVDISGCPNLLTIFPSTMLGRIQSLEDLRVWSSCSVEEVLQNDEMTKPNISQEEKTKFTQLRYLELSSLSKLKRFCSGGCVVFPALTQLKIWECEQIETFMHHTIGEDMGSSDMHPLFNEKVEFPSLKELHLRYLGSIMSVWDNRGTEELTISFRNLRKVEVFHCQTLKYLFPSSVAQQLYHLEELSIFDCGVETIACRKEEEVKEEAIAFVFPRLVTLNLESLPKLESFYPGRHTTEWPSMKELVLEGMFPSGLVTFTGDGGGSFLIPILEKIESLEVKHCPGLSSFGQGLVSFKLLTELQVSNCDGLVSLVQFPTAKSLVQLRTLKVFGCETMKEIVASESAGEAEDEIVFSNLKALELVELPNVANFYLGNCILNFPSLEEVTVLRCYNMEAFCGRMTITPKLRRVSFTEDYIDFEEPEWQEENKDLNTIIMYQESYKPAVRRQREELELAALSFSQFQETYRPTTEKYATSPSERLSEANDDICENSKEAGTDTGIGAETWAVIVKQGRRGESFEGALKCSEEVAEKNDKAAESNVKGDETNTYKEMAETRNGAHTPPRPYLAQGENFLETNTYKEMAETRNGAHTPPRPYFVKGSLAPTPDDTVDVTCPSSQSLPALDTAIRATTCQQKDDFEGLQVTRHLVPLLEKARDMHGDFHTSPWIKSKAVRITAIESVGQVLWLLQTETPRTIDAETIQFMMDAFNDLCIMSFPVEWLGPLLREADKWLQRKAKIEEMEAQLQAAKREMEMDKALDQPLLDM